MGGSSWGYKGGLLGAVPLERKTPGFWVLVFAVFCLVFLCGDVCVWVCLRLCGCALVLCVFVLVVGLCGCFGSSVGGGFLYFYFPEIPFAMLSSSFIFIRINCYGHYGRIYWCRLLLFLVL